MKIRISGLIIVTFFLAAVCFTAVQAAELPLIRIGIVKDGPWARHIETVDIVKHEITSIIDGQFDVRFVTGRDLDGDWTVDGIRETLARALANPDIDMVIALGHVASHLACRLDRFQKPVIAALVIDAKIQRLPHKKGTTGVEHLNYIDRLTSIDRGIQAFRNIVKFRNLAILTDGYIYRALPELEKEARKLGYEYSINVDVVPVETSAEEALANLPPKTDAVIINPLFRLTPAAFQTLVDGFSQLRIPSYSYWGRQEVELGILATITQGATMDHLARSVAVNVLEILDGQKAGDLPVTFTMEEQLTINMATARATGVYPSLSILTEADLINEEVEDIERVVTIEQAAKEAVSANLDLAVANREVAAGQEAVIQERSSLLPQLGLGTTVGIIDDDRARARGGFTPERSWTGTAAATQMIYSENAWSNYTTEKHLQNSRVSGRDTLKLDIIQSAATAYLNVLRAKAIENIQKENLKLTRANLQRARVRLNVGVAGPDEVYRWESQIASSRRVVLEAESITLDTMISLNRILHRPLQELFTVKRVESDILFTGENWQFSELVDNTRNLNALKAFLIKEGISLSPELMGLEAQISARERRAQEARREFWVPTVSLSGNVKELLSEEGDGQREDALASLNDTEWRVGVLATFPLFTGGRKSATVRRTREELTQLRTQYDATKERIEQRILIAVNRVRASAPGVRLSRDAAETARRNLKLVSDSYARGIKSIIDLLDAQNLVLVTNQQAANATYGFLADIISVQRSVGEFVFMLSLEQRQTRVQKLEDHMERLGIEPDRW